ncbi:SURF1 family protein [Sphingomonas naphthae]|uniref:SURF1-like protein n=1 Tax=Sphingomonas naphthae TaxID=1813468 RepID=A0ABY7TKG5_9SPHN|nr:SURF1 family protein [Sphingomonas naphthae]WCT73440.1 SURF1 family protein [Sphingomonas naphthae]
MILRRAARLPLLPTVIVALAVGAMIALGLWQLRRAEWKEALLVLYTQNSRRPAVTFPLVGDESYLFRRSSLMCLEASGWTIESGINRAGQSGWRHLARCRTGIEGPGALVDLGWSKGFDVKPAWGGGRITGSIASKPDHRSLIASFTGEKAEPGLMLIADQAAPGLEPSGRPSVADIPNNHRAYAVQWFIFAALAVVIYGIALRRRGNKRTVRAE